MYLRALIYLDMIIFGSWSSRIGSPLHSTTSTNRDNLPAILGIIYWPGSFAGHFGDHLQVGDHLPACTSLSDADPLRKSTADPCHTIWHCDVLRCLAYHILVALIALICSHLAFSTSESVSLTCVRCKSFACHDRYINRASLIPRGPSVGSSRIQAAGNNFPRWKDFQRGSRIQIQIEQRRGKRRLELWHVLFLLRLTDCRQLIRFGNRKVRCLFTVKQPRLEIILPEWNRCRG